MFSWFKKERTKSEKPKSSSTRYIYKPYENAMAFRVEFRETAAYIYRGWSKSWAYRLEDNKIYTAGSEEVSYIIIGNKVCNFSGEETLPHSGGQHIQGIGKRGLLYNQKLHYRAGNPLKHYIWEQKCAF